MARLSLIRKLRERDWLATLPRAYREQYAKTKSRADQIVLVEKWHEEERMRQREWESARDHWEDIHQELPHDFKDHLFQDQLNVFLGNLATQLPAYQQPVVNKMKEVPASDRYWVWYRTVVDLADKTPLLPTPPEAKRYGSYESLPDYLKNEIKFRKHPKIIQTLPQYWPAFAIGITDYVHKHKLTLVQPLGPSKKSQMPKEVQPAIDELWRILNRAVNAKDKPEQEEQAKRDILKLVKAEGKWPDYPQTIMELARNYKIQIPGWTLPKSEFWDKIRKPSMRKDKS